MTFPELNFGDVFYIDGAPYQCFKKHGRLTTCLALDPETMQHVPDANDPLGIKTTLFSDLRVNSGNATPAQCADYLLQMRVLNSEQ